jgi:hypothetical protein
LISLILFFSSIDLILKHFTSPHFNLKFHTFHIISEFFELTLKLIE